VAVCCLAEGIVLTAARTSDPGIRAGTTATERSGLRREWRAAFGPEVVASVTDLLVELCERYLRPPKPASTTADSVYGKRYRARHRDRVRADAARRQREFRASWSDEQRAVHAESERKRRARAAAQRDERRRAQGEMTRAERHEAIRELHGAGLTMAAIALKLAVPRSTVGWVPNQAKPAPPPCPPPCQ
jgi:hypothetical protein